MSVPQAKEVMTAPAIEIFPLRKRLADLAVEVLHKRSVVLVLVMLSWDVVDSLLETHSIFIHIFLVIVVILEILYWGEG